MVSCFHLLFVVVLVLHVILCVCLFKVFAESFFAVSMSFSWFVLMFFMFSNMLKHLKEKTIVVEFGDALT